MNEIIQSLMECLKKETEHYRKLATLAEAQKEVLVAGNVDALSSNVRLEEKEVFALNPIVSERNDLLARLAKIYQVKTLSLDEALKRAPAETIEEFKRVVVDLVKAAQKLESLNQGNEKLLGNALNFATFTLKVINNGGKKKPLNPLNVKEETKATFVNRIV